MPVVATAGFGVKAGADAIERMPSDLPPGEAPQTSYVYANDGETLITTFYDEARKKVSLKDVAPSMQQAMIAAEDSRFFEHNGVDAKGVVRAFVTNQASGEIHQGASTLTMQYVRNMLLTTADTPAEAMAATQQSSIRKVREMRLSIEIEKKMSKLQILEGYLNIAYYGHRAYGVFAAAHIYFSKHPKDLTPIESALLAGLVQAPSDYDPVSSDKKSATARRDWVFDRMVALKYLDLQTAATYKTKPIELKVGTIPNDCVSVSQNDWGFFCDFMHNWWLQQPQFGATRAERENSLRRGGYTIVTTLDPAIQAAAIKNVMQKETVGSSYAHGAVLVQPGTGEVKAMAVNRIYALDQSQNGPNSNYAKRGAGIPGSYPNTVVPLLGGGDMSGYQAGSTFKMFTMLAALDAGMPLNTNIYSPHKVVTKYVVAPGGLASCGDNWCPSNASGAMTGSQTMWSGFGKSVNTYFAQLIQRVGSEKAVAMAQNLGLQWHNDVDRDMASDARSSGWGAFTLGVSDTTPLEMAAAYATIAADGVYCAPMAIKSVTDPNGAPVHVASQCRQAVPIEVARAAVDATRCTTGYGAARGGCGDWSTAPSVYKTVGRPVGGKTGTTDSDRAAWFVAFTPELAVASFMADPDNPFHPVGGGNAQKPIETGSQLLRESLVGQPIRNFIPPGDAITFGTGR
ncbi:MAG: penicillin-binding protein [Longispora sp.]|nr:penicillin-binding protein [Longispora sp. (in: high G+C Gram-positive bacteria)]